MADVALPGSRKFNGRCRIRTCDLLLVRTTGRPTFYGENSTKFNQDCTICRSRRHTQSDSTVPQLQETGNR